VSPGPVLPPRFYWLSSDEIFDNRHFSCSNATFTQSTLLEANMKFVAASPADSNGVSIQGIVHQNLEQNVRGLIDETSSNV
jgi:hypothetical protein